MTVMYDSVINDAYSDELIKLVRSEGVVRIVGGSDDLVVLTRERYDSMRSRMESAEVQLVSVGLRDIEDGETIPAEEVMADLKKEFDL